MANSWRCVAYGSFDSGPWAGEIATISFSGAARDSGAFSGTAIDEALPEFAAVPSGGSGSSTHFTWAYGSSGVGAWTEANQEAIGEVMWEYLDDIKANQSSAFSWREVRISAINSDGTIVNGASVGTMTPTIDPTATQGLPPQLAIVSSLITAGRGPRNRGRLYIPAYGTGPGTGATVSAGTIGVVNTATKTAIDAFNAISGIRCAVVSRTHATYSDVTFVRCGDQFDTQRRRRNGVRETYTSLAM